MHGEIKVSKLVTVEWAPEPIHDDASLLLFVSKANHSTSR